LYLSQSTSNLVYSIAEDTCTTHRPNPEPFVLQSESNAAWLSAATLSVGLSCPGWGSPGRHLVPLTHRLVQTFQQSERCKLVHKGCKL